MRVVGTYDWWVLSFIFSSASFGAVGGGPQQHPHLLLKCNNAMSHEKKTEYLWDSSHAQPLHKLVLRLSTLRVYCVVMQSCYISVAHARIPSEPFLETPTPN